MYMIRELEEKDIKTINVWRNDPELILNLGAPFRYINEKVDLKWFENYMLNRHNTVRCAITDDEDNILGLISLNSIDHLNQSATLNIMVGEKNNQNKGIGTFAIAKILEHGFDNLNLNRIELMVLKSNTRAIHLYEKMGFVLEGTKRKARFKNGKFVDLLCYSILRNEYNNQTY